MVTRTERQIKTSIIFLNCRFRLAKWHEALDRQLKQSKWVKMAEMMVTVQFLVTRSGTDSMCGGRGGWNWELRKTDLAASYGNGDKEGGEDGQEGINDQSGSSRRSKGFQGKRKSRRWTRQNLLKAVIAARLVWSVWTLQRHVASSWLQTLPSAPFIWGGSPVSARPDDHKTERVCTVSGPDWEHMVGRRRLKEPLCAQRWSEPLWSLAAYFDLRQYLNNLNNLIKCI